MHRPRFMTVARLAAGICVLALLSACAEDMSFLAAHGPVAEEQRAHIIRIVLIVSIVVVPAVVLAPFLAWRYRYGGRSRYAPRWDFSWGVEAALWGVPVAITLSLMATLLYSTLKLDPYAPLAADAPPMRVQVVGYDWKWLFVYPDHGIASVGELVWPADRPLRLELTSATVMQSFHVPQLGSQIYAMAGMRTELNLLSDGPGVFGGQNTQYNGDGFWTQKFAARAVDPAGWSAWLEDVRFQGLTFDAAARAALEAKGTKAELARALGQHVEPSPIVDAAPPGVVRFRGVPPDFFASVMASFGHAMPPFVLAGRGMDDAALAALLCGPVGERPL